MEQKLLVVVNIIAGRNFPRRPECSLEIEARFNGEVLCTDPLPHSGGTMIIDNELAWEMTKKALQQHKLNRTPIKLQCYAVDGATKSRQTVGYVMLDLRTAHPESQQLKEPNWYGVLNSAYSRLRPQLQVALTLEEERGQISTAPSLPTAMETRDNVPALSLTLDPSGGYYHLIPSPHSDLKPEAHHQLQLMHTLSLTLSNAKQLPKLPAGEVQYYFYYCLLGNDITSEPFIPPVFSPERASIRLKSSRDLLSLLFASQPDLEIHLCCGSDSVAKASLPLRSLASKNSINSTLKLDQAGATVDVAVQLEQVEEFALPTSSSATQSQKPHPLQEPSPKAPPTTGAASGSKVSATPPNSSRSARRNLTRSFEEASLNTPSSKNTTGSHSTQSTPAPSSSLPAPTSSLPPPQPEVYETNGKDNSLVHVAPPPVSTHSHSPPAPPVSLQKTAPRQLSPSPPRTATTAVPSTLGVPPTSAVPSTAKPPLISSFPLPSTLGDHSMPFSKAPPLSTSVASVPVQAPPILLSTVPKIAPAFLSSSSAVVHRYKFSVDLRSIHNTTLDSSINCYLRYSYPFFGCPYPVVVQPPVPLSLNVDRTFTQSYCSFEFATEPKLLTQHISDHPLVVEVWQSCEKSHDIIIGTSKIILSDVFSGNKAILEGGVTRQICSLRSLVTPPPPSHHHSVTLGHINAVLVVEDHGPIDQSSVVSSAHTISQPAPVKAHEVSSRAGSDWTTLTLPPTTTMMSLPTSSGGPITHLAPPSLLTQQMQQQQQQPPRLSAPIPQTHAFHKQNHRHPPPQLPPNNDVLAVDQNYGHLPPQLPPSSVVGSAEYDAAMELEMWKLSEEENFQQHLKEREKTHMAKLGEEWQKREEQRQQLLRQKLEHYSSLERQLQGALDQVQDQQRQLSERETKFIREKDKMLQERQLFRKELEAAILQVRTQYEHQLEMERLKSSELQSLIDSHKKQIRELESRLSTREAEFERYRQQIVAQPESKLQAELSIAHLEKAELERKLLALSKSKQHYKEQWSKALSELAACRQREQTAARERLLSQQQELEMMRARYLQHEEQNSIRAQLQQVKNEVEQLQENTLAQPQPKAGSISPSSKPPHTASLAQHSGHMEQRVNPTSESNLADTNVARWIEERDILLQTGVYTSSDPTIQKLDLKIREALAKHTNTTT